jgi:hypothetical protein
MCARQILCTNNYPAVCSRSLARASKDCASVSDGVAMLLP